LGRNAGGLGDAGDAVGNFTAALGRRGNVPADLAGRGRLLLDGAGNRVLDVVDLVDDLADPGNGFDSALGVALDGLDLAADVLSGLGGLLGQLLDLIGDDGEALSGLAGPASTISSLMEGVELAIHLSRRGWAASLFTLECLLTAYSPSFPKSNAHSFRG